MRPRLLLSLLLLAAGACTGWHPQTSPAPREVVAQQHGRGYVRVVKRDGSALVLQTPSVQGDSIVGVGGNPPRLTGVPLAEVQRVDVRGFSPAKTSGLAVAGLALVALLALWASIVVIYRD
jgi:hypothetical protein